MHQIPSCENLGGRSPRSHVVHAITNQKPSTMRRTNTKKHRRLHPMLPMVMLLRKPESLKVGFLLSPYIRFSFTNYSVGQNLWT